MLSKTGCIHSVSLNADCRLILSHEVVPTVIVSSERKHARGSFRGFVVTSHKRGARARTHGESVRVCYPDSKIIHRRTSTADSAECSGPGRGGGGGGGGGRQSPYDCDRWRARRDEQMRFHDVSVKGWTTHCWMRKQSDTALRQHQKAAVVFRGMF